MGKRNDKSDSDARNFLEPGTIIDSYMIEKPIAGGGFSSVYLARQLSDQTQVAIKEYLPRRIAHRTWGNLVVPNNDTKRALFFRGRRLFLEEAKALARLKHRNIVEVLNFFQQNSTVYIVMTYDYGKNLAYYIRDKKGSLSEQFLLIVFSNLLDGIKTIHEHNLLHLDIKPDNILIRPGGDPVLLDFGAVHPFPASTKWTLGKVLSQGYSPPEQYPSDGVVGPWSDVYAVGASMRTCIEGKPPPPALQRKENDILSLAVNTFKKRYSRELLEAIDWALEIEPMVRPQSVDELLGVLPLR